MTKPKICKILNVEVGQRLSFGNMENDICFDKNGDAIFPDNPDTLVPASVVLSMINNPKSIIRREIITETDFADTLLRNGGQVIALSNSNNSNIFEEYKKWEDCKLGKVIMPTGISDYELMVFRFANPKKSTGYLAAIAGMERKKFEDAVTRGMEEEALRIQSKKERRVDADENQNLSDQS